jgi:hypothetical protein
MRRRYRRLGSRRFDPAGAIRRLLRAEVIGTALLDAIAPNMVSSILLLVAGVLTLLGLHAGLYVLIVPVVVALAGGVISAWLLLTKVT